MRDSSRKLDFFWLIAVLATSALALLIFAVFTLVSQFDMAARTREQSVVENGVVGRVEEVARIVATETVWDEAVRHLDNRFDEDWANENVGQFLIQTSGFKYAFVLDDSDQPIFASGGEGNDLGVFARFARDAGGVAQLIRTAELRRGALSGVRRNGEMIAPSIQASTIAAVDGEFYVLTGTLVQPDFGTAMPHGMRAPIVMAAMALDQEFLVAFARRYLLTNLRLHGGDARGEQGDAHAVIRDLAGAPVATLVWKPQNPGYRLMREIVAPILVVVACLCGVALAMFRRGRRMAKGLVASEARAAHLAYHDSLTGLPNRVLFFDRLGHALDQMRRSGRVLAVHCIDLDRFKEVNDTYGHHVGDELIREAAHRMAAHCRGADTFARLSGDEFAIVQFDATAASAAAMAARFIEIMADPFELSAGRIYVGCSVGVTLVSDASIEPAEALRQADLALYRAKEKGKVQYCFFEMDMDVAIKTRRALEADLREALARGMLEMAYQPQVNKRGMMMGVEALVRWTHPVRGVVPPAFFVRVAEECGLIGELGLFTLRRAFVDSRRWPDLKVAINVSANQLRMKEFLPRLSELVAQLRVEPKRFELEITEGILLGDDPLTHESLRRLRQMGFSLALDDFGTGYSSLSYLQRYPINKIKIDRSFITNLGVDAEADAVVGAIVKLARALNLSVIAEGVETNDQRARLAAAGCSEIQGYLFSKPVSAERIDQLSRSRTLEPATEAA